MDESNAEPSKAQARPASKSPDLQVGSEVTVTYVRRQVKRKAVVKVTDRLETINAAQSNK